MCSLSDALQSQKFLPKKMTNLVQEKRAFMAYIGDILCTCVDGIFTDATALTVQTQTFCFLQTEKLKYGIMLQYQW